MALDLDFGACSGAKIGDMSVTYSLSRPPYADGTAQLDRLDSSTKLVTLGIGGNDLDFEPILTECITASLIDLINALAESSCEKDYGDRLQANFDGLVSGNKLGELYQEVRRRAVASSLSTRDPGTYYNVLHGQTIWSTFQSSVEPLSVSTQWPGSDVVLTLASPSGLVIDRNVTSGDIQHEVGPTFESYHLSAGEPGTWTTTLFGAQVAPEGEPPSYPSGTPQMSTRIRLPSSPSAKTAEQLPLTRAPARTPTATSSTSSGNSATPEGKPSHRQSRR